MATVQPLRAQEGRPKIFGIGFQKTGTTSLAEALRILGYRTRHGVLINNPVKLKSIWIAPPLTREKIAARVLPMAEGADMFCDNPWPILFRELDAAYPGSKFILTTRASESWIASMVRYFGDAPRDMMRFLYGVPHPAGHEGRCIETYRAHNEAVRRHFADRPDDLLEIDLSKGDGWSQLCTFLDHPVPATPFPHKNTIAQKEKTRSSLATKLRALVRYRPALPEDAARRLRLAAGRTEGPFAARLWRKVLRVHGHTTFIRKLVAAYFCLIDRNTPLRTKIGLVTALTYFVMPVDAIPDFIAGIGYLDDAALLAVAIWMCERFVTAQHRARGLSALGQKPAAT